MDDLRVLHVINRLTPSGGAEVSLAQLLPGLSARGVAQAVVSLAPPTAVDVVAELERAGVRLYDAGGLGVGRATAGVRRAALDFSADLLSSSLFEAEAAARLTGALTGTPVLCGLVNTPYAPEARRAAPSGWKLRLVGQADGAMARHLSSHFHALTEATARSAVAELGVRRDVITVVPRGRDRNRLGEPGPGRRSAVRRALGLDQDALLVLNVARQERQKGQPLLVDAFEHLASADASAQLVIAGRRGAGTAALEERVATSPVADRIHLLGVRDDVPDLLSAADVFAFSSLWEGMGGAVLEAMAMEVPVLAFEVPAVAEALGGCGTTVALGDATGMGRALVRLAQDPAGRREYAVRARERFDRCYELAGVLPQMEALYRRAAAEPAPGRRRSPRRP